MCKRNMKSIIILIAVISASQEYEFQRDFRGKHHETSPMNMPYVRIKRYHRRPFRPEFLNSIYSHTPPPSFLSADEDGIPNLSAPMKLYQGKTSNRNLNDNDIAQLFKNLSKEDLDKVLEFAGDQKPEFNTNQLFADTAQYMHPYINNPSYNAPNINQAFHGMMPEANPGPLHGNNEGEEVLPSPVNLRDPDTIAASPSRRAPTYAKPPLYKIENFGDLPLSDHSSRLFSESSYNVPHYSVTSYSTNNPSAAHAVPQIEPAPSATSSAAYAESDAHLKAVKIWSHRSKGAAYTLHDDGTLSVERPTKSRPKYPYP